MTDRPVLPEAAAITVEQLEENPAAAWAALREVAPVAWVPALGAWVVTDRALAVEVMRDAERYTVDDERFSTGAVLGENMLSLDGAAHARQRTAFAAHFRPRIVRERMEEWLPEQCRRLLADVRSTAGDRGRAEFRRGYAGPLAVTTIAEFLGLPDSEPDDVLRWYGELSNAITDVTLGREMSVAARHALHEVHDRVTRAVDAGDTMLAGVVAGSDLHRDEMGSATAVVLFGAIETSEGMTANTIRHLLSSPATLKAVRADRSLLDAVIEESLRLEPAASVIDRYTITECALGGVTVPEGDLVNVTLLAANRDPAVFPDPDRFDPSRSNLRQHLTFVQGPHLCIGLHLARMETRAALDVLLDEFDELRLVEEETDAPAGLVFRKPDRVTVSWSG